MRIGVIELMSAEGGRAWTQKPFDYLLMKQYASIMPQVVSVWCRQLNHEVFYATYFGQKPPEQLLPGDLDVVFISTFSQASALAYALAKIYRQKNVLTIIGGPHAKQFPEDCLRFFDIVVRDCDRTLIAEILKDTPRGQIVSTDRALQNIPSVEERLPEIQIANFWRGNPYPYTFIPVLSSTGCPFSCGFCVDWNNPYNPLPLDRLENDLNFILNNFPGVRIYFSDPNFDAKSGQVLDVLETVNNRNRPWYLIESNLSTLNEPKLKRLRDSGCLYVMPGIESWTDYSKKSGIRSTTSPRQKLDQVVAHFNLIHEYIMGAGVNFLFGLDADEGNLPVELTKEFLTRVPFAMPNINIPTPFGGTPFYKKYSDEGRILTSMPFAFYYTPYLVTTLKNYSPLEYYQKLTEIISHITSSKMTLERFYSNRGMFRFIYSPIRTLGMRQLLVKVRHILKFMGTDIEFRAFHEGESKILPEFYHHQFEQSLGRYADLVSREERQPLLPLGIPDNRRKVAY